MTAYVSPVDIPTNAVETSVVMACGIRRSALPLGSRPHGITLTAAEYLYIHFICRIVQCTDVVKLENTLSLRIMFC